MKTRAEVEALKANWTADPCYDIDPAPEGFEEHAEELASYSRLMYSQWADEYRRDRRTKMLQMGLNPDKERHGQLFDYIQNLQARIAKLEAIIFKGD